MEKSDLAVETRSLTKYFGDIRANDGVDLSICRGEVHGIVGENGAGKSTLLNMLFGLYQPTGGKILVDGQECDFSSPSQAMASGIGMVHQHFMLVEPFTVLENIMLGAEGAALLSRGKAAARATLLELEKTYGFDLPLETPVADLSVGVRQRAEILKALYRGANILILDEPTAVLTPQETQQLFALVRELKAQGKTVLFVTHKLNEILQITDRVSVIRAGKKVADRKTSQTDASELAELMVGRRVVRQVQREAVKDQEAKLVLDQVSTLGDGGRKGPKNITLSVKGGEVVGIAGVAGNGQTELLELITGLRPVTAGTVAMGGVETNKPGKMVDPITLRRMGMAHVAEDRLKSGAVEVMTGAENAILGYQREPEFCDRGRLRIAKVAEAAREYFEEHDVRPRNPELPFSAFSGGNQQKLIIARETAHRPDVLVIGQPTRGVDIGAVTRIHDLIVELRNYGKALLVVSADLDELLSISDRIAVMSEGQLVGVIDADGADEQQIGLMMAGQKQQEQAGKRQ